MNVNQVTFGGHLGHDASVKETKDGKLMVALSIASTEKRGEEKKTTWIKAIAFGYAAENVKHAKKGDAVIVTGSLDEAKWKGKDGTDKREVQILVRSSGVISKAPKEDKPQTQTSDYDDIPF